MRRLLRVARRVLHPLHRASIVTFLLVGFALRIHRLGDRAVWWDEGLASWAARQSWAQIAHWTAHDVHPPLYFWLLQLWRSASGGSEFALRFPSALIGTLTIAAAYLLGREVGGRRVGWLAALFLTLSRFGIDWSQEARMYALVALWAALALWAAVRVWQYGRWRDWALYLFFMAAGLYTLYLFVMVLVVVNLTWLLLVLPRASRKWAEFWRWSLGQTAVLLLFAPWLAYALGRIPTWTSATPLAFGDFLQIYWTTLVVGVPLDVASYAGYTLPVLTIFVGGVALLLWQTRQQPAAQRRAVLLLLGLLLPALVVYFVSLPKTNFFYAPQIAPRYLIIFLAAYVVLLAWGITQLENHFFPHLITALLALVVLVAAWQGLRGYYAGRVLLDDYKSLARTLSAYVQPQDGVVLYTDTDWPIWAHHYAGEWRGVPHAWQLTPQQADAYLEPIWQAHDGVWVVITPYAVVSDPQQYLLSWLAKRATAVSVQSYGDKALHFYARLPERATLPLNPTILPQYPLAQTVGNAPLLGYDQATRDARNGDAMYLALYWGAVAQPVPIQVGIVGEDGEEVGLLETVVSPTANLRQRQELTLNLPPDLPGGPYRFYARSSSERIQFGELRVRARFGAALQPSDVSITTPLQADFDAGVRLLGYDLRAEDARPGGTLALTLYWQAQAPIPLRYKVFTHLMGSVYNANSGNFLWAQQDNEPVNFSRPLSTWRVGEVIVDPYMLRIPANAPSGSYEVVIGLYDPVSGARLPLLGADGQTAVSDHLILTRVTLP